MDGDTGNMRVTPNRRGRRVERVWSRGADGGGADGPLDEHAFAGWVRPHLAAIARIMGMDLGMNDRKPVLSESS